jgi:hypothetical protein
MSVVRLPSDCSLKKTTNSYDNLHTFPYPQSFLSKVPWMEWEDAMDLWAWGKDLWDLIYYA